MKFSSALVAGCMLVSLCGCLLRGKQVKTPPPPPSRAASAPAKPPAPEPNLSVPQTQVQLPSPQPVSPEALASIPEPSPPQHAEPTPAQHGPRRPVGPAPPPAGTPAAAGPVKPEEPPATPPAVEERPRIQPIVPADEQRRIVDAIEKRRREINDRLEQVTKTRMTAHQRTLVSRIRSFLTLSDDAAKRGDMPQADALSERALLLARELQVGQ